MPKVTKTIPPEGSLVFRDLLRVDFTDAHEVELPPQLRSDVDALLRRFALNAPRWVRAGLAAHDFVAGLVGFESGMPRDDALPERFTPGMKVGAFEVVDRSEEEIVLRQRDRWLDFRGSLLVSERDGRRFVALCTAATFKSSLARAYFAALKPFHELIVSAMLEHLVKSD